MILTVVCGLFDTRTDHAKNADVPIAKAAMFKKS